MAPTAAAAAAIPTATATGAVDPERGATPAMGTGAPAPPCRRRGRRRWQQRWPAGPCLSRCRRWPHSTASHRRLGHDRRNGRRGGRQGRLHSAPPRPGWRRLPTPSGGQRPLRRSSRWCRRRERRGEPGRWLSKRVGHVGRGGAATGHKAAQGARHASHAAPAATTAADPAATATPTTAAKIARQAANQVLDLSLRALAEHTVGKVAATTAFVAATAAPHPTYPRPRVASPPSPAASPPYRGHSVDGSIGVGSRRCRHSAHVVTRRRVRVRTRPTSVHNGSSAWHTQERRR